MKRNLKKNKRKCFFRRNKIDKIDPKDVELLKKFISPTGKILPSSSTKVSSKYQRKLAKVIKTSRKMGLLPFCI